MDGAAWLAAVRPLLPPPLRTICLHGRSPSDRATASSIVEGLPQPVFQIAEVNAGGPGKVVPARELKEPFVPFFRPPPPSGPALQPRQWPPLLPPLLLAP